MVKDAESGAGGIPGFLHITPCTYPGRIGRKHSTAKALFSPLFLFLAKVHLQLGLGGELFEPPHRVLLESASADLEKAEFEVGGRGEVVPGRRLFPHLLLVRLGRLPELVADAGPALAADLRLPGEVHLLQQRQDGRDLGDNSIGWVWYKG